MKFYTDTHIPKAVAVQLKARNIDILRCEDVNMGEADDEEHLEYATAQGRTLISRDRDFWEHHAEWLSQGLHHCGIVLFSNRLQGDIGKLVKELFDLYQMIEGGAGTLENDVYNQVYEIDR